MQHLEKAEALRIASLAEAAAEAGNKPEDAQLAPAKTSELRRPTKQVRELEQAIRDLSREARNELRALMYLGRGDAGDDFAELVADAEECSDEENVRIVADKSVALSAYIRAGLVRISKRH